MNPSDDNRDSAYYSSTDASSKRAYNILVPTWLPRLLTAIPLT